MSSCAYRLTHLKMRIMVSSLLPSSRNNVLFFIVALALCLGLARLSRAEEPVSAAPTPVIAVRTGNHQDFDRIVFDWPHHVSYSIHHDGTQVRVQFGEAAQINLKRISFDYITRVRDFSAALGQDNHLVASFTVSAQATVKDFTSGSSVVVDIQGEPLAQTKSQKPDVKTEQVPVPSQPNKTAAVVSTPAPGAPKAIATTASPTTQPSLPAAEAPLALTSTATLTPPPQPVAPVQDKVAETATLTPESISPPQLTSSISEAPPKDDIKITQTALPDIGTTPMLVVSLDSHVATRTAIFERAGYGYIVFEHKLTLGLTDLIFGQPPPALAIEPLDLPKVTGYRFRVPLDAEMRATRNGTAWQIYLSKQHPDVPVSTALVAQPDFALGARLLLPLPDAPLPIHMTDPVVGDDLILVPLEQTEAFSVYRRMADFAILPAAQGLVIKPLTDKVLVRAVSDGMEITSEGGLHLSRAIDTGASQQSIQKAKAAAAGKSLFDFAVWRGKPNETFTDTRQRLMQTIVDVPEAERNRARLELVRFYFSQGNGEEAIALMRFLTQQVPDLASQPEFLALRGAAEILTGHADDGLKDLTLSGLTDQPEIELWQAVAEADLRNWQEAEARFSLTESILASYPEPFFSHFAVLAIEAALAAGKDSEASDWLNRLEDREHNPEVDPAIAYLRGVLHSDAGRAQAAETMWKQAAASHDRLYKIRAELALVDLGVATGSLTPAQAADRLEGLRFAWRGDDLEVDILHRLGQFYIQAKNIKDGLTAMSTAVRLYPDSPLTPKIRSEMSDVFRGVFLGDLAPNMSPLDSLTLYQQFRDLMPTGADGDSVIKNLAERLVAIDLLDQAASLLDELIKNRLQGEDKGHVGARLAAIRLLNHEPDAAIEALDATKGDNYTPDFIAERQLLRAKAYAEQHKDDDALALLQSDNSKPAKILRADINMHAQRWAEAAKTLLDLVGPPPKLGEALTHEQAQWIVNTAIALSLAGDQVGLDKLAIDFSAAMAGTPQSDTFRVLTRPEKTTQLSDITAAQSKLSEVDMFQGFLDSYRKSPDAKASDNKPADTKPADTKPAEVPEAKPTDTKTPDNTQPNSNNKQP